MAALIGAALVALLASAPAHAATREYWVAAVPTRWNPVTNGHDAIHGTFYDPAQTVFPTVTYRLYTRGFKAPKADAASAARASGDPRPAAARPRRRQLRVHFKNLDTHTSQPHSMHFHGVEYPPPPRLLCRGFSGKAQGARYGEVT